MEFLERVLTLPSISGSGSRLTKDFRISRLLGAGAYGAVVEVVNVLDKASYAIKIVASDRGDALREVQNLVQVPAHPNKVNYYTFWQDKLTSLELTRIKQQLKLSAADEKFR
jgi:serine/threonine protein kinase